MQVLNSSPLEEGLTSVVAGVLASICLILAVFLCAKSKKKNESEEKEDLEIVVDDPVPEATHTNGIDKQRESVHSNVENETDPLENNKQPSSRKLSKKGKKELEKQRKLEEKKRKEEEKEKKREEKEQKRLSRLSRRSNRESTISGDVNHVDDHEYTELIPQKRIAVDHLQTHIEEMRASPLAFRQEYERLPSGKQHPKEDSIRAGLETKNRFHNILPYDHSRVLLEVLNGNPITDYINACYIDGYKKDKAFVAAQGPTADTISDFWRMVWELDSTIIVMVTRLVEAGMQKCKQYWPEKREDFMKCDDITVTYTKEELWPDYKIRTFKLEKEDDDTRFVRQYHFMGWPDHGTPAHATALLNFRRKVKSEIRLQDAPCIVHCSAGVGRSGTFIAMDILLDQADQESVVDVFGCVARLRDQRVYMVQTLDQYIFVHNALLESITVGETTIPCFRFEEKYKELQIVDPKTNTSPLVKQFKILDMMKEPLREEDFSFASEPENKEKNRDPDILPANRHAVRLMTQIENRSNYINGSFIEGYRGDTLFIATQMPLVNTQVDLWRTVYDYKSSAIVMLNMLDEDDEAYWPKDNQFMSIAPFHLNHVKTDTSSQDYILRTIKLTYKKEERNISQITVKEPLKIDPSDCAASTRTLFQLHEQLQQIQRKNQRQPIIVHCMKGVELTGTFLAVSCLCDMINAEQEVDVFRIVKHIRQARPQFINSQEQYNFLYEVASTYMKQFGDYSNFQ